MRKTETGLRLSATDVSNSLACRRLTAPLLDLLIARGAEHEKAYVDHLKAQGREVLDLSHLKGDREAAVAATLEAMRAGQQVIVQAALRDGRWYGLPDVLLRTEKPGTWPWFASFE